MPGIKETSLLLLYIDQLLKLCIMSPTLRKECNATPIDCFSNLGTYITHNEISPLSGVTRLHKASSGATQGVMCFYLFFFFVPFNWHE